MIRKLRRKFILTNMLLVSLVLIIVFVVLVGTNYQRVISQSEMSMRMALKWSDDAPPPRFEIGSPPPERQSGQNEDRHFSMVPVFVVTLDGDGGIFSINNGNNVEVSDQVANQAVAAVGEADQGTITSLDLRYLRETDRDGTTRLAFSDLSWERASLWPLIRISLLVGAAALVGLYLIALLLSNLALRPAEEAWEQQRRFVADASHELKTPITVILTNAGILLSHPSDTIEKQQKWVSYIRDEAQRMRGLVEDLLFLAKNDAGKSAAADPGPVDLSELAWSALLPFEPVAFERDVALTGDISPALTVTGRSDQLRRLIAILLDNAVKYAGPKGKVSLSLSPWEKPGAKLTVHNTGAPIAPAHLEHLFERFYRADDSRARVSGGYGLGLAIAKSIVDGHNGTITVTSTEADGTVFTVKLPGA